MDESEIVRQGREAEEILDSDVFKLAFVNYKTELLEMWEATPTKDQGKREQIYTAIKILPEVEKHLRILIEKGKISPTQINSMMGVLKK